MNQNFPKDSGSVSPKQGPEKSQISNDSDAGNSRIALKETEQTSWSGSQGEQWSPARLFQTHVPECHTRCEESESLEDGGLSICF